MNICMLSVRQGCACTTTAGSSTAAMVSVLFFAAPVVARYQLLSGLASTHFSSYHDDGC